MTSFPLIQVCQSLRLRPRGKRKQQVNWFKKSPKKTKLLKCNFSGHQTGALTASANRMGFSTFGLSKAEMDFNSQVAGVLQQRHPTSAAASQRQTQSPAGSPPEQTCLVRLCSLPKFELVSCKEDFFIIDIFQMLLI